MTDECEHRNITFKGHLAAPGYGQSYECDDCGEALWSVCNQKPIPFKDLEHPPELTLEDIR